MKVCNGPLHDKVELPDDAFWPRRFPNGKVGLMSQCKECSSHRQKEWVKEVHEGNAAPSLEIYRATRDRNIRVLLNKMTPAKRLIKHTKNRARQAGIDFDITEDDILFPTHCPIFGYELDIDNVGLVGKSVKNNANLASIDRIDPSKGYVKGNIEIISWRANKLKNNATIEELILLGKYYAQRMFDGCR